MLATILTPQMVSPWLYVLVYHRDKLLGLSYVCHEFRNTHVGITRHFHLRYTNLLGITLAISCLNLWQADVPSCWRIFLRPFSLSDDHKIGKCCLRTTRATSTHPAYLPPGLGSNRVTLDFGTVSRTLFLLQPNLYNCI